MKKEFVQVSDLNLKFDTLPDEQKSFMTNIAQLICDVVNKAHSGYLSAEEVETKFKAINETLKAYDAEKFEQLVKDNNDLCDQVKNLGETLKKLQNKGLSMDVINKFDEKISAMLDSEKFKDFANGHTSKSGAFDGFSLKEVSMAANYTGDVLISQQQNRVVTPVANKKVHMRDVIATLNGEPEYPQLAYAEIYDFDRNAAFVTENGTLPESSFKAREKNESTKRLGTYMRISKRMLKSRAYVRSYILNMLPEAVLMAEDFQMLFGDGNGENLLGIVNRTGVMPVETIIGTAIFTGKAGEVKSVTAFNGGKDALVEFEKPYDLMLDGMTITFAGATTNATINGTWPVQMMADRKIVLVGCAITGDEASANKMTFTVNHSGYKSVDEPNSGDAIETAFAVMNYAQFSANTIVLNPITVNSIKSEKDSMGRNLGLITTVNGVNYIGGKPIVESTNIPAGKYILGDFVNGANLIDYTSLTMEWCDDVESKLKNQVVLIAQEEVIMPVYMPWAFAYGSLAALINVIKKA